MENITLVRNLSLSTVFFCAALLMLPATADVTHYGYVDATIAQDYRLTMAVMIQPYDSQWFSGPVGRYMLSYSNLNYNENMVDYLDVYAFCVEAQPVLPGATYRYDVLDAAGVPKPLGPDDTGQGPMGSMKSAYLEELWGRFFTEVTDNVTAAAFALAVYEIVFEDLYVAEPPGWDVATGKFMARDDGGDTTLAIQLANDWLEALDGTGPRKQLFGLTNNTRQDFIVASVPLPGAIVLLGIGIGFIGIIKRRDSK